jgi:hypothetical protein
MSQKLVKPLNLSTKNIKLTEVGCVFSGQETEAEVFDFVSNLKLADRILPFALADAYNKHPEIIQNIYDPIQDGVGHYSIGSIKVYATTLKNWPAEERRWQLGISFYQAVYHLPKPVRDKLMDLAVTQGLSRTELRQEAKLLNNGKGNGLPANRDDVGFEQDQYIYKLEQRINELEQGQDSNTEQNYTLIVQSILKAIETLAKVYPQGVQAIRDYLEVI